MYIEISRRDWVQTKEEEKETKIGWIEVSDYSVVDWIFEAIIHHLIFHKIIFKISHLNCSYLCLRVSKLIKLLDITKQTTRIMNWSNIQYKIYTKLRIDVNAGPYCYVASTITFENNFPSDICHWVWSDDSNILKLEQRDNWRHEEELT